MLSVEIASDSDGERWNAFVRTAGPDHYGHLWEWRKIISSVFGHEPYYFIAEEEGEVSGVLPLFLVKSRLFGSSLISVPYLNSGGILAANDIAFRLLLERAAQKKKQKVGYVEFRAREPDTRYRVEAAFPLAVRTHKVAMRMSLPASEEELMNGFDKKLRSQIRRPVKDGVTCTVISGSSTGKEAALNHFYEVFAENMRDLGTPVYPKKLWETLFEQLPENSRCIVAYHESAPVAAAVTVGFGGSVEISWASSLRRFNHLSANMLLYFESMKAAIQDRYRVFDFGRSTRDSGTFKFKAQWGAEPKTLHWYYIAAPGDVPDINPSSRKFTVVVSIWRRLPLSITKTVGPWLTKSLP